MATSSPRKTSIGPMFHFNRHLHRCTYCTRFQNPCKLLKIQECYYFSFSVCGHTIQWQHNMQSYINTSVCGLPIARKQCNAIYIVPLWFTWIVWMLNVYRLLLNFIRVQYAGKMLWNCTKSVNWLSILNLLFHFFIKRWHTLGFSLVSWVRNNLWIT